jgi:predicted dehydrogenase
MPSDVDTQQRAQARSGTPPRDRELRIALVGAGFIAESHLRVLQQLRGVRAVAICDPSEPRARRLARQFGVPNVFRSLAELTAQGDVADAVHVLVPPDWHAELAAESLKAGLHTFVEKPLALDAATCRELGELAKERGLTLAVNHNMTFMPVWQRLRRELWPMHGRGSRFGRVEHLQILHHVGLRQLAQREYDHFLFATPANILLEQGVHLFSLVEDVLGRCKSVRAHTLGRGLELPGGGTFHDTWSITLACERGTAELFFAFGRTMPEVFAHVVGADASARIDLLRGTYVRVGKSQRLEALDHGGGAIAAGLGLVRQGLGTIATYATNLLRLARRGGDPFARSMDGSIRDFVTAIREGTGATR